MEREKTESSGKKSKMKHEGAQNELAQKETAFTKTKQNKTTEKKTQDYSGQSPESSEGGECSDSNLGLRAQREDLGGERDKDMKKAREQDDKTNDLHLGLIGDGSKDVG